MAPVVAVVAAAVAKITVAAVVKFVVTTALSIGVSRLLAKRAMAKAQAGGGGGGRVQLPPATDNKLPVVYGSAFLGGNIIDAMITANQRTMWYVVALAEKTDNGTISFGDIYYDGKLVQFGSNGAVTALINNATTPSQSDTRVNGNLFIYLYNNGSNSPTNSSFTAQQVLSVANGVPAAQAWGPNNLMTDCAFAIVRVNYNDQAGVTSLGALTAQVRNTESGQGTGVYRPGTALRDYMTNIRYGCAIPLSQVDTTSLDDLNTYSSQTISVTGGPTPTQARYRINGPLDTATNCLDNLQFLVDSCDSWLQYSELTGKWKVVINKAYTQSPGAQTTNDLFIVNSSNLVGGIEISPIDLNETYNQVEVAYPNTNIKDQTDYQIINLFDTNPSLLSQNEAVNRLNITLPLVNNAVQAKYLAARRIYQSREDLVISFRTDYSGIQVEAGDVIRVYHETYGWDADNGFPDGKLFRVSEVLEEKDGDGNLYASFRAFEYNATVYADTPVQDFIPAFNTGLSDPNIIGTPATPTIVNFPSTLSTITGFQVQASTPSTGLVMAMDFNYGLTSNPVQHRLYQTVTDGDGTPMLNSNFVKVDVNDLPAATYYWSTVARNQFTGARSNSSAAFTWAGANVQPFNPSTGTGGIANTQIKANTIINNNIQNNTIEGGKVANNTLQYINMGNSLITTTTLGTAGFEVSDTNIPIDVNSRTSFDQSFYVIGTNPGASYYYPWYQATSTTANGYQTNSTGVYTPTAARDWERQNGDWDWYILNWVSLNTTIAAGERVVTICYIQVVADMDTTWQVQGVFTVVGQDQDYIGNDIFMHTFQIKANQPQFFVLQDEAFLTGTLGGVGVMLKNLTTGSQLDVVNCNLQVLRAKGN